MAASRNKFLLVFILMLSALLTGIHPAHAAPTAAGPSDPAEMEVFIDGLMAIQMAEKHIPGAVVALVKDGSLFFAKGYGYADLEQQIPVDPERTLFRPGSVSKLFVWTAIMQQVEQGKLALDADVNQYLDFTIPATFPEPITLRHLLTHTPGFEDFGQDLFKLNAEEVRPLGEYLKTHLPARVFPPGTLGAYSNYGTALAGYIIERVTGQPFVDYVEDHILTPLEMERSTFRQQLPTGLAAGMSKGYNFFNGGYVEGGFEYVQAYPAGSLSATAADMAKFMIAHLQNGQYEDTRILQEATARQMHEHLFTHDSRLDGMAYGFFENTINGQRVISHGGDTLLFHSGLYLLPGQNVGLFFSSNSTGGSGAREEVLHAFMDRYYPEPDQPAAQPAQGSAQRLAQYVGEYTAARSNFTTVERLFGVTNPVTASLTPEGYLVLSMFGQTFQYVEIEPGLLQDREEPSSRLVARTGPDGVAYLLTQGPSALIKTPWYASGVLHGLLLSLGLLFFLGALIGWPIAYFNSLPRREPQPILARLARWVAVLFGLLLLIFLFLLGAIISDVLPGFGVPSIFFRNPPLLDVWISLTPILAVLAAAMLVFCVLAWINRYWRPGSRIFYTLLTLLAISLVWALYFWNLLL